MKRVKLIDKKNFAKGLLDKDIEAFLVYVNFPSLGSMIIYSAQEAQTALLHLKKATISTKYVDFVDIFSKESAKMFLERTSINKHVIEWVDSKQVYYGPIYSYDQREVETSKDLY